MSWSPNLVANIFDTTSQVSVGRRAMADRQIMDLVQLMPELDTDPELLLQRAMAMFACFTGNSEPPSSWRLTLQWRCIEAWRQATRRCVGPRLS